MARQRRTIDLVWNAIHQSINRDIIEPWNVFNHGGFVEDVMTAYKKHKHNRDEFLAEVKSSLMYYYWSKCEWEVILPNQDGKMIITPWVGGRDENICLDVSDDRNFNWREFYDKMVGQYTTKRNSIKIDVYDQVMFVWDAFSTYLWNSLRGEQR